MPIVTQQIRFIGLSFLVCETKRPVFGITQQPALVPTLPESSLRSCCSEPVLVAGRLLIVELLPPLFLIVAASSTFLLWILDLYKRTRHRPFVCTNTLGLFEFSDNRHLRDLGHCSRIHSHAAFEIPPIGYLRASCLVRHTLLSVRNKFWYHDWYHFGTGQLPPNHIR